MAYQQATHIAWLILVKADNGEQLIRGMKEWTRTSDLQPRSEASQFEEVYRVNGKILSGFKNISWEEAREKGEYKYLWEPSDPNWRNR